MTGPAPDGQPAPPTDAQPGASQPAMVPPELVARRLLRQVTGLTEELAMTQAYADMLEAQLAQSQAAVAALQEELIAATAGDRPATDGDETSARP